MPNHLMIGENMMLYWKPHIIFSMSVSMIMVHFSTTIQFLGKEGFYFWADHNVFLYDENNKLVAGDSNAVYELQAMKTKVVATSELQEGIITYSAENVLIHSVLKPWVEGVTGSGIGEKLIFTRDEKALWGPREGHFYRYRGIILSNGFVDYNRPYLYEYNNRVKKIRVSRGNPDEYVDIEVEDTPLFQYIDFGEKFQTKNEQLIIEILDVYRGSRYDDTCINLMVPMGRIVDAEEEAVYYGYW